MATVNPVIGLDAITPLTSLAHLIDDRSVQQLALDTPEDTKKIIGLLVDQIRKVSAALDITDLNFATLYGNDGNLNTTIDKGTATIGAGSTSVTVAMNTVSSDANYRIAVSQIHSVGSVPNSIEISSKTTTQVTINISASNINDTTYDWIVLVT